MKTVRMSCRGLSVVLLAGICWLPAVSQAAPVNGWLNWRGPYQTGVSDEKDLPDTFEVDGKNQLWTYNLSGRGCPVIADGKVYAWGYSGTGPDLQEALVCLDAETGKRLWEHRFNDFMSDMVYERYSIGSPVVDAETGNVYLQTSAGIFAAFTGDGRKLWEHSMMETFGRLTFPNGRTGAPVIDDDLVIIRGITANWGGQGPAADRFYAFDKRTGELVWSSTPGLIAPKDSSYSTPFLGWMGKKRVFYVGTGDGSVVCVNARTGDLIWRYKCAAGGINGSVVVAGNILVAGHADENLDSTEAGRMIGIKLSDTMPAELDKSHEAWRMHEALLTSSTVVVGDVAYQVNKVGELLRINVKTGHLDWRHKLGPDQLHASPLYADGKLYIPMRDAGFFILKPTEKGAEVLSHTPLEGEALGAPAVCAGKIYFFTTKRLYCFGGKGSVPAALPAEKRPEPGPLARIQVVPNEVVLRPGGKQAFTLRGLDADGNFVKALKGGSWKTFIPPTARVKATMDAEFNEAGELVAKPTAKLSAGSWEVTAEGVTGQMRGRVVVGFPYKEDFGTFSPVEQTEYHGQVFAWPPLPWIGARFKWNIQELEGAGKVFAKTLDTLLFQRAFTFIGDEHSRNYTVSADVMSDGNRRMMSNVGVINQRYVINLVGNWQQLEVVSNQDRLKVTVPFKWSPKEWYRVTSRVDVAADGSGVVRAKAWKRGEPEPEQWTIEVPHKDAHKQGSPGLYGFALQAQFPVYVDNVEVTSNE